VFARKRVVERLPYASCTRLKERVVCIRIRKNDHKKPIRNLRLIIIKLTIDSGLLTIERRLKAMSQFPHSAKVALL
jgi:hypothetical protein